MTKQESTTELSAFASGVSRRRFLGFAGGLAGLGLLTAATSGCGKDDEGDGGVNLGSGDIGILNYAYALEQLEAAFYIQVITQQYSGMTVDERALLTDIRDHEVAHREFFKAALAGNAIQGLTPNFSAVNFADRTSVLTTAKTFEDLGVSAYNGAGKLIVDANYLLLAGKIVSVEARHAAYIRDLLVPGSFANSEVVDTTKGLDVVNMPSVVLTAAQAFITERIDGSNLPTT